VALGGVGVVPVFGWASRPVKEIVAPGLSSKQTRLRELVAGGERCAAPVFAGQVPDGSQARELYPTLPQQLRAWAGGPPSAGQMVHDGSPKLGCPRCWLGLVDRQRRVIPSHVSHAKREEPSCRIRKTRSARADSDRYRRRDHGTAPYRLA
jgi:hypothetical protein